MRSQNNVRRSEPTSLTAPVLPKSASTGSRGLTLGLKVLEHLATCETPATQQTIASALKISGSSVYRSMVVLEQRGYVARIGKDGAYATTRKLFHIQSTADTHQRLLSHAQPIMCTLSESISQSCNLSIPIAADMQVVSHQESSGPYGINVPIGFRYDIPNSAPGLAFTAFMKHSDPASWPQGLSTTIDAQWTSLKKTVQAATEAGFTKVANPYLPDVIDLSCPIFDKSRFVAALTVPYIKTSTSPSLTWCLAALQQAAERLNASLQSEALVS
ncbi:hypothetical protein MMA231_04073 (plasmid) [Asticcacaulis sp. MM231]|uniref:IclR family transcriptional regulator n=1 Tax=Asticcacaulis sp. MM231 TaxID=3157666 RepID=UPI0032D5AFAF